MGNLAAVVYCGGCGSAISFVDFPIPERLQAYDWESEYMEQIASGNSIKIVPRAEGDTPVRHLEKCKEFMVHRIPKEERSVATGA